MQWAPNRYFSPWTWVIWTLRPYSSTCSGRERLKLGGTEFSHARCPSCHPTIVSKHYYYIHLTVFQVQALMGTQSTEPSQWSSLVLPSFIHNCTSDRRDVAPFTRALQPQYHCEFYGGIKLHCWASFPWWVSAACVWFHYWMLCSVLSETSVILRFHCFTCTESYSFTAKWPLFS